MCSRSTNWSKTPSEGARVYHPGFQGSPRKQVIWTVCAGLGCEWSSGPLI